MVSKESISKSKSIIIINLVLILLSCRIMFHEYGKRQTLIRYYSSHDFYYDEFYKLAKEHIADKISYSELVKCESIQKRNDESYCNMVRLAKYMCIWTLPLWLIYPIFAMLAESYSRDTKGKKYLFHVSVVLLILYTLIIFFEPLDTMDPVDNYRYLFPLPVFINLFGILIAGIYDCIKYSMRRL